jgi:hypothetical protein
MQCKVAHHANVVECVVNVLHRGSSEAFIIVGMRDMAISVDFATLYFCVLII